MFQRPDYTYNIDYEKLDIQNFLNDEASPLTQIVRLIPDGSKVLDIGAGNGLLGWLITHLHSNTIIDGVEPSIQGSLKASGFYRTFFNVFFQEIKDQIIKQDYDFIILADVIEHLSDPFSFLLALGEGLSDKTKIVMSIPNVAHGSVRLSLLNGDFDYVDSGLLERTHLRFFTLKTIKFLVEKLNLNLNHIMFLQRPFIEDAYNRKINMNFFSLFHLLCKREALTYQYLIVVSKQNTALTESVFGCKPITFFQYCIMRLKQTERFMLMFFKSNRLT